MSETKITNNYSLEEVVKSMLKVLQPEPQEEPEDVVIKTNVKTFKCFEDYTDLLQFKHVRAILGLSEAKTYEVLNSKKCPSFTVGKCNLIEKQSFMTFLEANENQDLID